MAVSDNMAPDGEHGAGVPDNVGKLLQADRLRRGQELIEVSKTLRIQFSYLNAIEQGKYENLPRGPYGLGFVRTYADYLGLDADEIVNRFKQECQYATERSRLVFPTPEQETSIPSGTVVVVSLALALAAYGVWYYTQTQDRSLAQLVEPVPERLVELTNDQSRAAPRPTVEVLPLSNVASASNPDAEDQGVLQAQAEQVIGATAETPAPDVTGGEAAVLAETAAVADISPTPSAPPVAAADQAAVDHDTVDQGVIDNVAAELAAIPAVPGLNRDTSALAGADSMVAARGDAAASRIVIRATDRSWVRVLGADDKVLLTRMLMPGDVYEAPNEPDLSLEAGNAGALEIEVDGTKLPPIGGFGEVVANYPLQLEALLAQIE